MFLEIKDITFGYTGEKVLKNVSLSVGKGSFVGFIGPNGAGKTTLFRIIMGILKPWSGEIRYKNSNMLFLKKTDIAREIAFMPQFMDLALPLNVRDFVMLGRYPHLGRFQESGPVDIEAAEESLRLTDTLEISKRHINELSGGEKQMVFLAQALAQKPELILLDEPTAHLDIGHQTAILNVLKKLNREKGLTIAAVMHDLNLAGEYCSDLILMGKGGEIINSGKVSAVLNEKDLEKVYSAKVSIGTSPISGKPHVFLASE